MSLTSQTKELLTKYGLKPVHHRGQNFLIQEKILDKIIKVACLKKEDTVLEVGPGMGFLTKKLLEQAQSVIAVELDNNLIKILKEEFKGQKKLIIKEGNILKFFPKELGLMAGKYKIVANLPYNITSRFMRNFLEDNQKPKEMILMVQKEVAKRIVEKPGQMSLLSLACQFYADCHIEFLVGRGNFFPIPKVESAVLKLKVKKDFQSYWQKRINSSNKIATEKLFTLAKIGFFNKRKKLFGNLVRGLKIDKNKVANVFLKIGISENSRAQELEVSDWVNLSESL